MSIQDLDPGHWDVSTYIEYIQVWEELRKTLSMLRHEPEKERCCSAHINILDRSLIIYESRYLLSEKQRS